MFSSGASSWQISTRDPLPGYGEQGLHSDWHSPPSNGSFAVVTALCLLDDFTPNNGATRLVPGTQRFTGRYDKSITDPHYVHPRQV
ncbi:MAG TPA: phytanoyl-CoA dioxygenase family protein [Pirellulales bacterium]|nr:phytanoyl-CoA dioxygenase family protein [Pirellulales bacterium]